MTDSLFKQIDEMPDEVAAYVAPHLNLMFRKGGGFIGADDVKDALRVISIYTRRYVRAEQTRANLAAQAALEEVPADELG